MDEGKRSPRRPPTEAERRRRGRNWALFLTLLVLALLFYAIAMVKMLKTGSME